MTQLRIMAGDVTADQDERVVSGLLLPYGEIGQTNAGRFSIDGPGRIEIPEDVSILNANEGHDQMEPRARFLTAVDTVAGILASFKVGKTKEGDSLLKRIDEGKKTGKPVALSAEFRAEIDPTSRKALSGRLTGAAFVARGAFPSAAILAAFTDDGQPIEEEPVETSEHQEEEFVDEQGRRWRRVLDTETTTETNGDGGTKTTSVTTVTEETTPAAEGVDTESEESPVTLPNTLNVAASHRGSKSPDLREMRSIFAALQQGTVTDEMLARLDGQFSNQAKVFAALTDVKYDATGAPTPYQVVPQWIGELWNGVEYQQVLLPLLNHGDLTAKTVAGWKWNVKPQGGDWTGNKTAIPSNAPSTTPYEVSAGLFAGGHDIAIEHRLFNTPGYFEAYWKAMAESYAEWADDKVIADVLAAATAVVADNPTGLTIGAAMSALIDGAAAVIDAKAIPTFALLSPELWKSIMKTPEANSLAYLNAALGLEEGTLGTFAIRASSAVPTGNILVGARAAATVHELPGAPIRIEAPDTVKGGVDTNAFGAEATVIHKATALQLVTPYTAA